MNRAAVSPCRLFVYLARAAPLGVVLRRGPSDWVGLSLWRTDSDTFTHGQWIRGRVYERRCDLSADGGLFAYFARKNQVPDSWLALSRPPWFTALALWFIGGTYCAGGFFPEPGSLWLGGIMEAPDQGELPPWLRLSGEQPYIDRTPNWTERTVFINRLLRDGWKPGHTAGDRRELWEHDQPNGSLRLIMAPRSESDFQAYGGPHLVEYAVVPDAGSDLCPLGRATWADWDQRGRLIVAQDGRLLHWQAPDRLKEIADFNPHAPEPAAAPAWAEQWPDGLSVEGG